MVAAVVATFVSGAFLVVGGFGFAGFFVAAETTLVDAVIDARAAMAMSIRDFTGSSPWGLQLVRLIQPWVRTALAQIGRRSRRERIGAGSLLSSLRLIHPVLGSYTAPRAGRRH